MLVKTSRLPVATCTLLLSVFFSCTNKQPAIITGETNEELPGFDNPAGAALYEFNLVKDPATGTIPAGIRQQELKQANDSYIKQASQGRFASHTYFLQGPTNLGGRTRSVQYDVRYNGTNRCLIAGGASGGIFKSTDDGATWVRKSPASAAYAVTTIVQDPRPGHQDTWYYGTGESFGGNDYFQAPPQGDGVYKSTDNGETWSKLPASNTGIAEQFDRREDCIWRLAVNPVNGDVLMAAIGGIFRSADEGNTWSKVVSSAQSNYYGFQSTDIVITSTGRLYAAFSGYDHDDVDGVWTSTSGASGTWVRIAGEGSGGSPAAWPAEDAYGRIVLAVAPSNEQILYALVQPLTDQCPGVRAQLFKWNQMAASWTNLSASMPGCDGVIDPLKFQGGYNMVIAVKPDDPNTIFIGGTNLYRSGDGFTTNNSTTEIGGYNGYGLHPDIHWLAFKPNNSNTIVCATDGGMYINTAAASPTILWTSLNNDYTTYQFYYVEADPRPGNTKVLGGTQDNGSVRNIGGSGTGFEMVFGGDGEAVGLSNPVNGTAYEYCSLQAPAGAVLRRAETDPIGSAINIKPDDAGSPAFFITLFKVDPDNTEYIYYVNGGRLFRNTAASTATTGNWTEVTSTAPLTATSFHISALATSRGTYNPVRSSLFFGSDMGRLYRLDDPAFCSPSAAPVNITGPLFADGGYISSIAVNPRNDDTVMVTFSSYNTIHVWWTGNANAGSPTWVNVERNLTLPSVRSSAIAVTDAGVEYFIGTSVGLFSSVNPITTDWAQEAPAELGNAVVSSLVLRPADNQLLVGTYGKAMWRTNLSSAIALPLTLLDLKASWQNDKVLLRWATVAEQRTKGFEVQRSYDGINFTAAGFVPAVGTSTITQFYQYVDAPLIAPTTWYRLKMLDLDGQYTLSNSVVVNHKMGDAIFYVTNPFTTGIDIRFMQPPTGPVKMILYDVSGRQLAVQMIPVGQGTVHFNYVTQTLSKGTYLLQVATAQYTQTIKLLKQ